METGQKERAGKEPEKQTPEAKLQPKKGRLRRWLRANRLPLLTFALVATAAGAMQYESASKESRFLHLYKTGVITVKELPLEDKFTAWRERLIKGICNNTYDEIMVEAQEEYFHQLQKGSDENASRIMREIEFYIANKIEISKDAGCSKNKKD